MKIALCLYGLSCGTNDFGKPVNFEAPYKNYKAKLLDCYDVDVFYHTWSSGQQNAVRDLWKPKLEITEPQIEFHPDRTANLSHSKCHSTKSRWYSTKKCNELRNKYEQSTGVKYDFVFLSRFDLVMMTKFEFESLDRNAFYIAANWGGAGVYLDLWFISNPDYMDQFCNLYDNFENFQREAGKCCSHVFCAKQLEKMNVKIEGKYSQFQDFTLIRRVFEHQYVNAHDRSKIIL